MKRLLACLNAPYLASLPDLNKSYALLKHPKARNWKNLYFKNASKILGWALERRQEGDSVCSLHLSMTSSKSRFSMKRVKIEKGTKQQLSNAQAFLDVTAPLPASTSMEPQITFTFLFYYIHLKKILSSYVHSSRYKSEYNGIEFCVWNCICLILVPQGWAQLYNVQTVSSRLRAPNQQVSAILLNKTRAVSSLSLNKARKCIPHFRTMQPLAMGSLQTNATMTVRSKAAKTQK